MIRVAVAADLSALTSLVERYWEFERIKGFDASRITTLLTDLFRVSDRGEIWVAQEGDRLVGYLLAVYLFSLEHGGMMAEIDEFFVLPEKRSFKIGAALLDAATATIAHRGIKHVQLQLGRNNLQGQRILRTTRIRGAFRVRVVSQVSANLIYTRCISPATRAHS